MYQWIKQDETLLKICTQAISRHWINLVFVHSIEDSFTHFDVTGENIIKVV